MKTIKWQREWHDCAYSYFADGFEIGCEIKHDLLVDDHNYERAPIDYWILFVLNSDGTIKKTYHQKTLRDCKRIAELIKAPK